MDEPYFDDDDLIGDYIDDDEPPPPSSSSGGLNQQYVDDSYLEEMMTEQQSQTQTQQQSQQQDRGGNNSNSNSAPPPPSNPLDDGGDDADEADDDNDYDVPAPSPEAVRAQFESRSRDHHDRASSPPPRRNDIFAFERYNPKKTHWRTDDNEEGGSGGTGSGSPPRTMHAKEWKNAAAAAQKSPTQVATATTTATTAGRSAEASAPASQLLAFQQQQQQKQWQQSSSTRNVLSKRRLTGLSYTPIAGQTSIPITLGDGTRMHVRVRKNNNNKNRQHGVGNNNNYNSYSNGRNSSYLGVSMDVLLRRVKAKRLQHEYDHQRSLSSNNNRNHRTTNQDVEDDEDMMDEEDFSSLHSSSPSPNKRKANNTVIDSELWVDKHAPSSFSHLLSDERTNRQVVRALREWDPYVFGREPPPSKYKQQEQQQDQEKKKYENQNKNPRDKRPEPEKRVILLSGPPGVGKTTLAHIIAKHVGYRPVEVNGSDERSAHVLTERVIRAMESHTLPVTTSKSGPRDDVGDNNNNNNCQGRPNCLILDEIDGADARSAIQALVDIIRADMPTKGSSKKYSGKKSNSKKKSMYLRRPIIFICNNLYAPALRPLLPYARQFRVTPPSPSRLVSRLLAILNAEQLQLSGGSSILHSLVSLAGGDIRSCLHTLQFVSAQSKQKRIMTASSNRATNVGQSAAVDLTQALQSVLKSEGSGMKDDRNDISTTITAIFRKEKRKTTSILQSSSMGGNGCDTDRVLDSVKGFGDNSRVLDSLFINILRVSYIDPTLDRCAAAHEWMSSSDMYRSHNTNTNDTGAMHAMESMHIPPAAAAIHLLCRVEHQRQDLTFTTREFFDARYQQEANASLIQKFAEGFTPKARSSRNGAGGSADLTVTEIPYILWILSAGEGPSALDRNTSAYDLLKKEKQAFDDHVNVLVSLGMTYTLAQDDAGGESGRGTNNRNINYREAATSAILRLEPPIDNLIQYMDLNVSENRREVAPALKELLAQRASHEKMRSIGTFVGSSRNANESAAANAKKLLRTDQQKVAPPPALPPAPYNKELTAEAAAGPSSSLSPSLSSGSPKHTRDKVETTETLPPAKRNKSTPSSCSNTGGGGGATGPSPSPKLTARNFLGIGAMKAKEARCARKAARVTGATTTTSGSGNGKFQSQKQSNTKSNTTTIKKSHTGSGVPLNQVIRLKYLKGFTEAVRTPCRLDDLS